jgi:hypothetical protein
MRVNVMIVETVVKTLLINVNTKIETNWFRRCELKREYVKKQTTGKDNRIIYGSKLIILRDVG